MTAVRETPSIDWVTKHLYAQGDCHGTLPNSGYNRMYVVLCTVLARSAMAACSACSLTGANLAPGKLTVRALLRRRWVWTTGLIFNRYHRVLNQLRNNSASRQPDSLFPEGHGYFYRTLLVAFFGLDETNRAPARRSHCGKGPLIALRCAREQVARCPRVQRVTLGCQLGHHRWCP